MSDILSTLTAVFTSVVGMVGDVVDTIAAEPLLLMFCLLPIVGVAVGMFKRLINVN